MADAVEGSADRAAGFGLPGEHLGVVAGVPETRLDAGVLARLPAATPPPPWETVVDAVLWLQRVDRAAAIALPAGLQPLGPLPVGGGGVIAYRDSPVGAYHEMFAALAVTARGGVGLHVPLMAVDSLPSVHGGRAHWALPKTLANFTGRAALDPVTEVRGMGWWLRTRVRPHGPAVPVWLRLPVLQAWPDGTVRGFAVTVQGRARLARVQTEADASVTAWLPPGHHLGVVLTGARLRVGFPRRRA